MKFLTLGLILAIYNSLVAAHMWTPDGQGHRRHLRYEYGYGVKDPQTGDIKNQWEQRYGDLVRGSYSLLEADGTTRIVEYYVDGQSGFQALVRRIGVAQHSMPAHLGQEDHQGHGQAASYVIVKKY